MEARESEVIKVSVAQGIFTRRVIPQDCHEIISQIYIKTGTSQCWEILLRAGTKLWLLCLVKSLLCMFHLLVGLTNFLSLGSVL